MSSRPQRADPAGSAAVAVHRLRDGSVVLVGALATVAVFIGHRSSPLTGLALSVVVAISTWLSVIDFRQHRLPNRIVGPLAVAVAVTVSVAGVATEDLGRSGRALGFGLAVAGFLLLANLIGGLGMGDVKFGFPVAATVGWFGWDALSVMIMVTTLGGAVAAVAVLARGGGRKQHLSYGPYMALGLVGGLMAAGPW